MRKFFLCAALALWAAISTAAGLTTPQQQALKAAALADPVASTYVTSPSPENDTLLAAWLNGGGTCVVWQTAVPIRDVYQKVSSTGTTWEWTTYIGNTTAAERDAWREMAGGGSLNPSLDNTRASWTKIFSGTGAAVVAQRAHLSAISQRMGSRAESALAVGACTALSPSVMSFEGAITQADASQIRSVQ